MLADFENEELMSDCEADGIGEYGLAAVEDEDFLLDRSQVNKLACYVAAGCIPDHAVLATDHLLGLVENAVPQIIGIEDFPPPCPCGCDMSERALAAVAEGLEDKGCDHTEGFEDGCDESPSEISTASRSGVHIHFHFN